MSKALLAIIQEVYISRGTSVILATHSPSTVALAPEDSIHVARKSQTGMTVSKEASGEAIQILTEGFIALSDSDISMLSFLPEDKLAILTEGDNAKILKRLLELKSIDGAIVIEGVEDSTGDGDVNNYYNLFSKIGSRTKVLCVWDCDCNKKHGKLEDRNGVFPFVIPHNPNNSLTDKGIENAFPDEVFEGFKIKLSPDGGEETLVFNPKKKAEFAEKIATSTDLAWFSQLDGLVQKIEDILKDS